MDDNTILLMQRSDDPDSRRYYDFNSLETALDFLCKVYETHLRGTVSNDEPIDYDLSELYEYLDSFTDLICMVFSKQTRMYAPRNKDWIKTRLFKMLSRQAS